MRSIVLVELTGLNSLSNEFGLVTMFQGVAAFIGAPLAGTFKSQLRIQRQVRGARNMTSVRPPLAAIFFMTYFHRAGGGGMAPSAPPPGSATESV